MVCSITTNVKEPGYDPIALAAATEKVVVAGTKRKYVQLGRPLRFYGGTSSATEVGCNLRCKFCFSDKPVWKPLYKKHPIYLKVKPQTIQASFYNPPCPSNGQSQNRRVVMHH